MFLSCIKSDTVWNHNTYFSQIKDFVKKIILDLLPLAYVYVGAAPLFVFVPESVTPDPLAFSPDAKDRGALHKVDDLAGSEGLLVDLKIHHLS